MQEQIPWHRLLGMMLTDFFAGSPFHVEAERDLSFKAQLLDILIVRKDAGGVVPPLPDGLRDSLVSHNLISFKSFRDTLGDWTLKELTGHYVNYRKQVSPSMNDLLPEEEFRLFALSAHYPQGLAAQVTLTKVQEGVYDCWRGTDRFRVVVLNQLPLVPNNSPLHLFSGQDERVGFGMSRFSTQTNISTMLIRLFEKYRQEGAEMKQSDEEFRREFYRDYFKGQSPEEVLKTLSPEERLRVFSPQEVLKTLSSEEKLRFLTQERLKSLTPQERIKDLSPADLIQALPPEVVEMVRRGAEGVKQTPVAKEEPG